MANAWMDRIFICRGCANGPIVMSSAPPRQAPLVRKPHRRVRTCHHVWDTFCKEFVNLPLLRPGWLWGHIVGV